MKNALSYCLSPRMRYLALFFFAYFAAGMAFAIKNGNTEFLFYGAVLILIIGVVTFMDRRVNFSSLVLWGLAIWGALHLAGGLMTIPESITEPDKTPVLYNMRLLPWLPKYDQFVHAFGFGVSAIATYESIRAHLRRPLPLTSAVMFLLVLAALGLGTINEIVEFVATLLIPGTNVGGYNNTGWDMISNSVGAILAVTWLKLSKADQKS